LGVFLQCGLDSASDLDLAQVKKSFLTSGSITGDPIVVSGGHQYSRVAAMRTRAASGDQYTVLFLLTGETSRPTQTLDSVGA